MANGVVVIHADKAAIAARSAQSVLPLDWRVRAADVSEPAAVPRVSDAAPTAMNDVDALAAWVALVHRSPQGQRVTALARPAREGLGIPRVEKTGTWQEHADFELAVAPGLIHALEVSGLPQATVAADGMVDTRPERSGSTTQHSPATREAHPEASVEVRVPGGMSAGTALSVFDAPQPERTYERQTLLTQFSQDGPTAVADDDTLRFTYHFRSWQGQPAAMISLHVHDSGRKLRVEAPDRAVYAALLANRDALPGILKIVDDEPHSRRREGRQQEHGE